MKTRGDQSGSSLPEVMATVGIVAALMAMAALGLNRRYVDLESSHQEFVNAIREVRLRASVQGAHYRLSPSASSYEIQRLEDRDSDGLWEPDPDSPARVVELPPGVVISLAASTLSDPSIEFDTRGVMVDSDGAASNAVVQIVLMDQHGERRPVEIWPSGQVQGTSIVGVVQ